MSFLAISAGRPMGMGKAPRWDEMGEGAVSVNDCFTML